MELNEFMEVIEEPKKTLKLALSQKNNLCVSKKLRENDAIKIGGIYKKVFSLIESDPITLWNYIHTKGNKTSLVRTAYSKLKMAISEIDPELIEENSKKRSLYYATKKLNREANNGILGTPQSNFQKKK